MSDVKPGEGNYKVIGSAAVLRLVDGSERYVYKRGVFNAEAVDAERIEHLVSVGLIEKIPEPVAPVETAASKYEGVSVNDLKAEIAKRNEGRDEDKKIVPAEPGNRAELVAALIADDK